MKQIIWVLICCFLITPTIGQYYLRGEIKNDRGRLLEGVRITLSSNGNFPYYSGSLGTFGISTNRVVDTLTLSLDGYESSKVIVESRIFQHLAMKMLAATANLYSRKLSSVTINLQAALPGSFSPPGESYTNLVENAFVNADKYPETGFAMNVDKASYSNIRRFINNNMPVPTDAIRIEEMLNYFDFSDTALHIVPNKFNCRSQLTSCPWEPGNRLLFLHLNAPKLQLDSIPASNLVFLIDISGSMDKPNRLPLLQNAFKLLVENLRKQDTISIVTYGGGVGIALTPTSGDQKNKINQVIDSLNASGDTPGEGAIRIAYDLAKKNFIEKGNNRVILATDGDFNIGQASEKELEDLITEFKQTGIYLTCLGVGMGNYKDSKLETLAKKGNGNFAYIDNLQEGQKLLVTEFTQTLYSVANNTFLKISFQPNMVKEYRLIGFDNKSDAIQDSSHGLEGGEVGSGHSIMAVFELKPVAYDTLSNKSGQLAEVQLVYEEAFTGSTIKQLFAVPSNSFSSIESAAANYRLAAAVSMFGSVLKQSRYCGKTQLEDVLNFAKLYVKPQNKQEAEFLTLVEKAVTIYKPGKKKKKE
ncbi:MAG: hypothetical protein RLZZ28_1793 [Bacteroidota bacterium]|jgi:Ca-activated chloride channel family protein